MQNPVASLFQRVCPTMFAMSEAAEPAKNEARRNQDLNRRHLPSSFRRRVKKGLKRPLIWLQTLIAPRLYIMYMWLVCKTSRIENRGWEKLQETNKKYSGVVAMLWHEEVFWVAYGYKDEYAHTLTTFGDSGAVINKMLRLCNYTVFQLSNKKRDKRNRSRIVQAMIEHMNETDEVIYGITCDGSSGPPYRMKRGGLVIAKACNKPMIIVRTWFKRMIRLPTWDRVAIPLPFNVIYKYASDPYDMPEDTDTDEGMEAFRQQLENDLIDLAIRSYEELGQKIPPNLLKDQAASLPTT